MANLWERQEGETDKAWDAFLIYRDMAGDATIAKTREALGKDTGYDRVLEEWSSKYSWPSRRIALVNHRDAVKNAAVDEGIIQDRKTYRETIKREAAQFARDAITLQKRAMAMGDEVGASLVFSRAVAAWEKARNVEGLALGLISGG